DRIQKELNATVIIIEHRLEEVLSQPIDRIILINDGEIVADKKPNDLLHEKCLEDVGVRSPLYLNALKKANVDLTRIPDLTSVAALPQDPAIAKQLQERSEEHTSELQSRFDLVCRLLLEKTKKNQ